ncbi:signal peptidase I [Nocardioides alcanivorans]|uniref:signal peptidase I n=1 Tax=Nocardioides alcanivorans TaxID=2897352 RepID=UPI001F1A8772|nr:signal peptidase I [Nocardioides alcanivorans]
MDQVLALVAATLLAGVIGLSLRSLGFVTRVESWSMAPSLAPGQLLLTRRRRASQSIRRGDVVVVDSTELDRAVVKRVLGLGGEHVEVSAAGVQVDGDQVPEPYVVHPGGTSVSFDVPRGHLLLLGDNRGRSSDSRSWEQPYLPVEAVRGVVVSQRWPAPAPSGRRPRPGRLLRAG